jgi:hypothetical protein
MAQHIEEELAQWKPDREDLRPILGSIFRAKADIGGEWRTGTTGVDLDSSALSIRKSESGGYNVDFTTGGCLMQWTFQREGTNTSDVFRLNKPIQEYRPNTYDTMYAVVVDGTEYLICQSEIRSLVGYYAKKGVMDWSAHIKSSAFHRKEKANKANNSVPK